MKFTLVRNMETKVFAQVEITVTQRMAHPVQLGESVDEYTERLRDRYKEILQEAYDNGKRSVAFTLSISCGRILSQEEELRVAADVISAFNPEREIKVYIVAHGFSSIDHYCRDYHDLGDYLKNNYKEKDWRIRNEAIDEHDAYDDFVTEHEGSLRKRVEHLSDTFSQYLLYLIERKHMSNAEVYKRAIIDRKLFSKIKNDPDYHPDMITALCLCIGAMLNLDESKDLLARAGYALSPCDKRDIVFSYFIEYEIYDMIELDIQLEELGLPCLIK